jgi:hypothetical protein
MELKDFIETTLEDYRRRLHRALDGLTAEELAWRPNPECNSITFTVWHTARVEDRWIQPFARDTEDVWSTSGRAEKFGVPKSDTGVGYSLAQVDKFPVMTADDLLGYADEVRQETLAYLESLSPDDFDYVPGRAPFHDHSGPTSTFGNRFSIARMFRQIVGEEFQHLGQVSYLRGMQRGFNG